MKKPSGFLLLDEMHEAAGIISSFDQNRVTPFAVQASKYDGIFLTGEGSSRIFPAKHARWLSLKNPELPHVFSAGSTEALDFDLTGYAVFGASNSGKTKETITLLEKLGKKNHKALFSVTNSMGSPITEFSEKSYVLSCGMEKAVAASKSLIEQALFYHALINEMAGIKLDGLDHAARIFKKALLLSISDELINKVINAPFIYFSGWNNGVAEELSLKSGEIIRKNSRFLDGTLLLHGIEEIMNPGELIVLVDPDESDERLIKMRIEDAIGVQIIAISERKTLFPTLRIPSAKGFECYIQMAAAWNLITSAAIVMDIDIDNPVRVKKVGNAF